MARLAIARDWTAVEARFLAGSETLAEFAEKENIPYSTLTKRASLEKWIDRRSSVRQDVRKESARIVVERSAESLASQIEQSNAEDLKLAAKIREKASKLLDGELEPADLRTLALTAKTAQDIARTALGADNPDLSAGSDQVWEVRFLEDDDE